LPEMADKAEAKLRDESLGCRIALPHTYLGYCGSQFFGTVHGMNEQFGSQALSAVPRVYQAAKDNPTYLMFR